MWGWGWGLLEMIIIGDGHVHIQMNTGIIGGVATTKHDGIVDVLEVAIHIGIQGFILAA